MIYKNLLRDFRKFYVNDFNHVTEYIRKKRRSHFNFYDKCLKIYLSEKQDILKNALDLALTDD